ncbi:hypothetical protein Dsin_026770 [Dipteronia sinensis]|uniref:DUF1985 domain-containing protein n=1 Tax=Dipteronia sinensis TaxID=43782 RepID=A0AAD9ZYI6_9ROSI|nr:hypothetical protein Dsin_026770 [Dipteronia sinensis]
MPMGSELNDLLKSPEDEWYDGKITRHDHFSDLKDIDVALDSVPEQFKVENRRRYTESCFGHFLRMDREMKFSGSIVYRLLLRELHHDGPEDEMRFMLGPRSVRFSKVEFGLITGLKFGVIPDTTRYEMVQNGIHQRYFIGVAEVDYEQLRAVLRIGVFEEQYDAVKLCLLYMLNWILMGLDERDKVPLWHFRLVEDLDAFNAFPWGAHVYRQSIIGFKNVLHGRRVRYERRQQEKGADVHTVETYNLYGLAHALLVFAYEVIPELGTQFGTRRRIEVSPPAERVARYYEGINEGGSLYMATDGHDGSVPDPLHHTTAGPSHTEGSNLEFGGGSPLRHRPDTEGSDPEFVAGSPLRRRQVRFAMPGGVHSREDFGGHRQDRLEGKIQDVMDAVAALREDLRKSDRERDRQHREVMDFLRGRWGSTSQSGRDGPPSHDRDSPRRDRDRGTDPATGPTTEADGPQTQSPIAGDTDVDPPVHIQDHTADPFSPLGQSPSSRTVHTPDLTRRSIGSTHAVHPTPLSSTRSRHSSPPSDTAGPSRHSPSHRTPRRDPRGQSPSSQHPPVVYSQHRQQRIRKRGWQLMSPYTDPCRPKRPKTLPMSSSHTFRPNDLVDADQLAAYKAYKRNMTGGILVIYFQSMLEFQWRRIMPRDAVGKAPKNWYVLKYRWSPEDLMTVRGLLPVGNRPWHEVDAWPALARGQRRPYCGEDPPARPVQTESPPTDQERAVRSIAVVSTLDVASDGVSRCQIQRARGNCGAHTLRLMEYVLANRKTFDWSEEDMCTIREKMAVEIFYNSKPH